MKCWTRKLILMLLDIACINVALIGALSLRFDGQVPGQYWALFMQQAWLIVGFQIVVFYVFNLYNSLWRYAGTDELLNVILSVTAVNLPLFVLTFFVETHFPKSVHIIMWASELILIGGSRISYRVLRRIRLSYYLEAHKTNKNVAIVGAGDAAEMVIKEFKKHPELGQKPVAIFDDDVVKIGRKIKNVPIVGKIGEMVELINELKIEEIIIAIPSAPRQRLKEIIEVCRETKCKLKTLPGVYEMIDGKVNISQIRDVDIEDLLGREPVEVDLAAMSGYVQDEVVLVTGGGGSIGSELCRQIARFSPTSLLILDNNENNLYDIQNELKVKYPDLNQVSIVANIREKDRINSIFEQYHPAVVFHAAAHKHVPLMEANPTEAIKNNVFGTLNVVEAADEYGAKRFVLISTDKAVNPTNIMGATKRVAEMIIQSMDKKSDTEFVAVRFGNVLGSSGSVVPLFKKQIARGGPVTVTHPEINRFFMTIPEAVQLVIQAGAMAKGGEIFVLNMGDPVKIVDLARDLIRLSGYEPGKDIKIEFTGLRPGEKLYEEIMMAEEGLQSTRHEKIFVGQPTFNDMHKLRNELKKLSEILMLTPDELIPFFMEKLVPTYKRVI